MAKYRLTFTIFILFALAVITGMFAPGVWAKTLYVGGTQSLTGPFAEDSAAVLAAMEDFVKYVNETKKMAPWREEKFPADITLEVFGLAWIPYRKDAGGRLGPDWK